jgi:hypothetical protein
VGVVLTAAADGGPSAVGGQRKRLQMKQLASHRRARGSRAGAKTPSQAKHRAQHSLSVNYQVPEFAATAHTVRNNSVRSSPFMKCPLSN